MVPKDEETMASINVTRGDGSTMTLAGAAGVSVMEIIRDAGVDDLLALCGGNCSCATCHVHVDAARFERLPPKSSFEQELLESSEYCTATSPLSCQVPFDASLDGLAVAIPPAG